MTDAIWSEVGGAPRDVTANRRDLQRAHLDRMTSILVSPPRGDARRWSSRGEMAAQGELATQIDAARNGAGNLNAYTQAHLLEAAARIEKALEAGLDAEGSG